MPSWLRAGDWRPGTHNRALLWVQLILSLVAVLRGLDYTRPRPPGSPLTPALAAAETAIPAPWGGAIMAASAVLVLVGLAARSAPAIVVAHLSIGAGYFWLGVGLLVERGVDIDFRGLFALAGMGLGLWLLLAPEQTVLRFVGVGLLVAGQLLLSDDLGLDYRTGVGLLGAAAVHGVLAFGTFVLWTAQRVRPVVRAQVLGEDDADG